jgi:hypothetical protein
MRADLGPQREDLGAVEAGARGVELRELDLAGRVAGHLADGSEQSGGGGAGGHDDEYAEGVAALGE